MMKQGLAPALPVHCKEKPKGGCLTNGGQNIRHGISLIGLQRYPQKLTNASLKPAVQSGSKRTVGQSYPIPTEKKKHAAEKTKPFRNSR